MYIILGEGRIKKTRKQHVCCICENIIKVGESCCWQTNTGTDESDFGTAYWHEYCDIEETTNY